MRLRFPAHPSCRAAGWFDPKAGKGTTRFPLVSRIVLTGDVMLGRNVAQALDEEGPRHVWGNALELFEQAEATFANLECVIATQGDPEPGRTFHFRAPPEATQALELANVRVATLANNHALDFQGPALTETLDRLSRAGIESTGAGQGPQAAWEPVRTTVDGTSVGVVATTDNVASWDAQRRQPGVAYAPADPDKGAFQRLAREVSALAREASIVIVSAHWGPNMVTEPSPTRRDAAHALLNAGADIVWGHSAHVFQGVERTAQGLILHDAGDTVDDYRIDPRKRNDVGFVFQVRLTGRRVGRVRLDPIRIDPKACQVKRADASAAGWARDRMRELCATFGTHLEETDEGGLEVPVPDPGPTGA